MKIIMRRVSVIFYSENHGNDNAVRRCLLDKIKNAYRLNSASHNILKKSVLLDSWCAIMLPERKGGQHYGTHSWDHIQGISPPLQQRGCLQSGIVPTSLSKWVRMPQVRLRGILSHSRSQHLPVPFLPAPDLCYRRNGHAPYTSSFDPLVLGNLSVRNR